MLDDAEVGLQHLVDQLLTTSKDLGLHINKDKSKVMVFERHSIRHPAIAIETNTRNRICISW